MLLFCVQIFFFEIVLCIYEHNKKEIFYKILMAPDSNTFFFELQTILLISTVAHKMYNTGKKRTVQISTVAPDSNT
jgi:hypothetical protein